MKLKPKPQSKLRSMYTHEEWLAAKARAEREILRPKKKRVLTPEQERSIYDRRVAGERIVDIAEDVGVSRSKIYQTLLAVRTRIRDEGGEPKCCDADS